MAAILHASGGPALNAPALLSAPQSGEQSEGEQQQAAEDAYTAAVARLTALLDERRPLYQDADITVSLEGSGPDADIGAPAMEVAYRVLSAINQRIKDDAGGWQGAGGEVGQWQGGEAGG